MMGQHPGLRKYWLSSHYAEMLIFCIHKMEVETTFSCIGQSTSDEKRGKINYWIDQIDMLLPKMSRHYVGARHIFSTNKQHKYCWQPKKLKCMIRHYHNIVYIGEHLLLQLMHKAAEEHDTPLISSISFRFPKR
jgi:hypothetical protein